MISYIKMGSTYITPIYTFVGLSSDTKPANVPNGSILFEMNTKKTYAFDEYNSVWCDITPSGSGGGGGSDASSSLVGTGVVGSMIVG